ncbi:MAG: protoporphyrinogen oxidase HemJ [Parvularculaceae bacterium]|nr:MAG: protoporphyrinogen oxidase HemJ [Parvularculaceae bacterium]
MQNFLAAHYLWLKAIHIIAVIAWFAGMMYLPRLFVYHFESAKGGEAEAFFVKMERRLLKGIMTPSMIAVWVIAGLMVYANPGLLSAGWFHAKLFLVLAISGIHGFYIKNQRLFEAGQRPRNDRFWRIVNEAPFVLMIVVAFLAFLKPF